MPIVICTQPVAVDPIQIVGIAQGSSIDDIDIPAGTQIGDVTYVFHSGTDGGDVNAIAGWTTLLNNGSDFISRMVWAATPPAQVDGGDALDPGGFISITLRGVNTTTPEDATLVGPTSTFSANPNPPAITTVTDKAFVIAWAWFNNANASGDAPSGYENFRRQSFSSQCIMIATKIKTPAGSEDPGTFTGPASAAGIACTLAVRPA